MVKKEDIFVPLLAIIGSTGLIGGIVFSADHFRKLQESRVKHTSIEELSGNPARYENEIVQIGGYIRNENSETSSSVRYNAATSAFVYYEDTIFNYTIAQFPDKDEPRIRAIRSFNNQTEGFATVRGHFMKDRNKSYFLNTQKVSSESFTK